MTKLKSVYAAFLLITVITFWREKLRPNKAVNCNSNSTSFGKLSTTGIGTHFKPISPLKEGQKHHSHGLMKTAFKKVLITSLARSASSIFGLSLSKISANSFYTFEPLWDIRERIRLKNDSEDTFQTVYGILDSFLSCHVPEKMESVVYYHHFCVYQQQQSQIPQRTAVYEQERCRNFFDSHCGQSDLRIVKTIRAYQLSQRLQLKLYSRLLSAHPDLIILVLIRDPRKVLTSNKMINFPMESIDGVCGSQLQLIRTVRASAAQVSASKRTLLVKKEQFSSNGSAYITHFAKSYLYKSLSNEIAMWIQRFVVPEMGDGYSGKRPEAKRSKLYRKTSSEAAKSDNCLKLFKLMGYEM
ncbi:uncharacterized protein LOC142338388 isoform X2 [Convolutriloba macropyga]